MQDEIIDIFDCNGQPLGTATRAEAHAKGFWHRSFHCWIIGKCNGCGFIIFQKRANNKKYFPELFDISVAGHYLSGESTEDAARELEEELGVIADYGDLTYLGERRDEYSGLDYVNCELCAVHALRDDRPLPAYKIDQSETAGVARINLSDAEALFSGRAMTIDALYFDARTLNMCKIELSRTDFVPDCDGYYLYAVREAMRILSTTDGEKL